MEKLPLDIKQEILVELSDKDLIHLCAVDKTFHTLCQKDAFWKQRGLHYFPEDFMQFMKKYNLKEKETYQLLSQLNHLRLLFPDAFAQKNLLDIYETKKLNLYGSGLKSLPKEIKFLPNLQELNLSKNRLKNLPKEIGSLSNLQILTVNYNELENLPKEIGNLSNLIELNLYANKIQYLPKEIGSLHSLKKLDLYQNEIQSLPKEIGSLSNLLVCSLSENRLRTLPKEILSLPNISLLLLSGNPLDQNAIVLVKDLRQRGVAVAM